MKKYSVSILALILMILFSGCNKESSNVPENPKPKNIILFIGDGMGIAQVYAAMSVSQKPFTLEKFPFSGFSKTYSTDSYITDSGAGGTAIACGVKTRNGMIGMGPDSTAVRSIVEYAHSQGLATGVVSTSSITHATPASFVAHNVDRNDYEGIAKDFLKGTIDVFIGGGEDNFRARKDSADLTATLKEQGFDVVYTLDEMNNSGSTKLAALLAKMHMPKASEGRDTALSLMTGKAIETLSKNKNGFFLMVEGSMIDWGGHEQNIDYVTSETIDLDKAIGVAYRYAASNTNTLIVVTADHETGGLTINGGNIADHTIVTKFSGGEHTGVMVPIFSYGPEAQLFSGIHENTFFLNTFLDLLGLQH